MSHGQPGFDPGSRRELLGVKTWLSTLEIVNLCLSDETVKAVGPFSGVYARGSKTKRSHTREVRLIRLPSDSIADRGHISLIINRYYAICTDK